MNEEEKKKINIIFSVSRNTKHKIPPSHPFGPLLRLT